MRKIKLKKYICEGCYKGFDNMADARKHVNKTGHNHISQNRKEALKNRDYMYA